MRLTTRGSKNYVAAQAAPGEFLSEEQIRLVAPSAYAVEPWPGVSDRYEHFSTIAVIATMVDNGFVPTYAAQSKSRDASQREFTKHMLRFCHRDHVSMHEGHRFSWIWVNSHNRYSAGLGMGGLDVRACMNGLVCCDEAIEAFKLNHTRKHRGEYIARVQACFDAFPQIEESISEMQSVRLSDEESKAFARAAIALRFDTETTKVKVEDVLYRHHPEQAEPSLWNTMNVIQENLIERGGVRGNVIKSGRRTRSRQVTAVDANIKLNKAIWRLGEEMRNLLLD